MADSYLERVAGEIADLAIADEKASGDIRIVDEIAKVLGSSSQTLEEAFLTAVRVRKAEARARKLLSERQASGYAEAATPPPAPMQGGAQETPQVPDEPVAIAAPTAEPEPIGIADEPAPQPAPEPVAEPAPEPQPAPEVPEDAAAAEQAAREKEVTEDAINRLKKAGIGMPRRITR